VNWEALGAIGDFVSGVAVLATLAYLLIQTRQSTEQLRQNTEATRNAAFEASQAAGTRFRELLITNPEAAELFERGTRDFEQVKKSERFQFDLLLQSFFLNVQSSYIRNVVRAVDPAEFRRMQPILDRMLNSAGTRAWWERRKSEFSPEFQALIESRTPKD
jgi:hypothetical protein